MGGAGDKTLNSGHLLIIDDEAHLVSVLEFTLQKVAGRIFSAGNAAVARGILKEQRIDCILCDINLPRMTGLEFLREIRSAGVRTPFIFFTAEMSEEALIEAAMLEATDYFFKPHFSGITEAIRKVLSGETHTPASESDYGKILSSLDLPGK